MNSELMGAWIRRWLLRFTEMCPRRIWVPSPSPMGVGPAGQGCTISDGALDISLGDIAI